MAKRITEKSFSKEESAAMILDYVQLNYIFDDSIELERDYIKGPLETMVERNGDCEDLSILADSLMGAVGLDVASVSFVSDSDGPGHVGIAVAGDFEGRYFLKDGKKYYYAETTNKGFNIGDFPEILEKGWKRYVSVVSENHDNS